MINPKYFLKGFLCIRRPDSPAIALGASFVAIGALLKNLGFTIHESIFSTFLTYALPGSLVMAESMFVGCLLYTSPSPRDQRGSRMPSSA